MNFPFSLEIPVAWGDMDAFGHVNNVVYLRYFESARVHFFEQIPDENLRRFKGSVKPILARIACQYKRPVRYPDTLTAKIGIKSVGNASFDMVCEMHSAQVGLAAVADCTLVMFDFENNRPVRVPTLLREFIRSIDPQEES